MTGLEPLIAPLVAIALDILKDKGKSESENLLTRSLNHDVGKDLQDFFYKAFGKYVENYSKRHGLLKVLGMREPVKLEEVFTTVQLLGEEDVQQFATIDDLEKLYRDAGQRLLRYRSKERREGITVASEKQFLMVLGAAGAGKSTFLRKIGLESFKGKKGDFKHPTIPVLLELKKFTESKIDLKALIEAEFTTCGFPKPKEFTEQALDQGKLLILLDGLDEVPSVNVNNVIDAIQDFVDRYDKNRFITSCRTAARKNLRRFSDVVLSEFDDGQIQQFMNNWFRSEEDRQMGTATRCWELLERPENTAAKELAHTPILLTFLCLTFDKSQTFANNRSGLYKKALRILLEEWAAEKRIMRQAIYEGLSVELEEVLLSEIAYEGFEADRLFVPQSQLVKRIKEFLSSNLNAPKQLSGEQVLDEIAIQQGILVERMEDVYSFSHLTLQEYLTARYIYAYDQIPQMVEKYLTDDRWREVFLLTSGLMVEKGSDLLLLEMHKASKEYARHPRIKALLEWADRVTAGLSGDFKPAAKRAVAISIFLALDDSARDRCSDIFKVFFIQALAIDTNIKIAIGIARAIDFEKSGIFEKLELSQLSDQLVDLNSPLKNRNPDFNYMEILIESSLKNKNLDVNYIKRLVVQFKTTNFKAFQLSGELITYDEEESEVLKNYLNSVNLLLKCKQEAARLSPATWEAIEVELLLLPDPNS